MCYFQVENDLSGHLASKLLISQNLLARFLKTLPSNGPLASNSFFFRPTIISKVAVIKNKECNYCFFLFSPFLPPRSCSLYLPLIFFVSVIFELIGPKTSARLRPCYLMTKFSLGAGEAQLQASAVSKKVEGLASLTAHANPGTALTVAG